MLDIASYCSCPDLYWYGCYGSSAKYRQYMISEAVKHPAKMSWGLLERILKHLEMMNLITQESVVIDFMAGTGRTNTMAALRRHKTISVELEPHFIKMIEGNKALLEKKFGGKADWDVIQGDSRYLSKLLNGKGLVGVISPPYTNQVAFQDKNFILSIAEDKSQRYRDGRLRGHFATPEAIKRYAEKIMEEYSKDTRNIGNLKDVPLVGVVSPPYSDGQRVGRSYDLNELDKKRGYENVGGFRDRYSDNPENIGNLKDVPLVGVVSPPYSEAQTGGGIAVKGYTGQHLGEMGKNQPDKVGQRCGYMKEVHGSDSANIGNLPDHPIVGITSPPYVIDNKNVCHTREGKTLAEYDIKRGFKPAAHQTTDNSTNPKNIGNLPDHPMVGITSPLYENKVRFIEESVSNAWNEKRKGAHENPTGYGDTDGQIGTLPDETFLKGETYLSAMLKVYQQAYLCGISPLVIVTKNPTRNGKLRRLDLDTVRLLEISGYEIFDYHRSVLFETHRQSTLDGEARDVHKGRISFFKRLSLEKGKTVAQWEDVIFARIPAL